MPRFPIRDIDRFMERVEEGEGGCWNWTKGLNDGYGSFSVGGAGVAAHLFSYRYFIGPVPKGLQVDHLCRNRRCCNPMHLEAVTQAENMRRSGGKRDSTWQERLQLKEHELYYAVYFARERLVPINSLTDRFHKWQFLPAE